MKETRAVDALPTECTAKYLSLMNAKGEFWHDLSKLTLDFGLRSEESRNLKACEINLAAKTITLSTSKQVKSYITKTANKAVSESWITQAQIFLYDIAIAKGDQIRAISCDLLESETSLSKLAIKLRVETEYAEAKAKHYADNIEEQRAIASKTAPKGRVIDYSRYKAASRIIEKRMAKCEATGGEFLFPANELNGSRAKAKGFDPVSRQAVYRAVLEVKEQLVASSKKLSKSLQGVRIGLSSLRKAAIQKVLAVTGDILAASIWCGHGNGSGDIATTQRYLDKSEKRMNEITDQLFTFNDAELS